jgi:hypothetical protein
LEGIIGKLRVPGNIKRHSRSKYREDREDLVRNSQVFIGYSIDRDDSLPSQTISGPEFDAGRVQRIVPRG